MSSQDPVSLTITPPIQAGPFGLAINVPLPLLSWWALLAHGRSTAQVIVFPSHCLTELNSHCAGRGTFVLGLIHTGRRRPPIDIIEVRDWWLGDQSLGIPWVQHTIDEVSENGITYVQLSITMAEAQINTVRGALGEEVVKSAICRQYGVPYDQRLDVRLFSYRRRGWPGTYQSLKIPRVTIRATGSLERP